MEKVLRVLSRGSAMVPDHAAFHGATHGQPVRFVGRKFDEKHGDGVTTSGGWERTDDVFEVRWAQTPALFNEYLKVLRAGDLWPADEATAKLAGVAFDPSFGGDHPALAARANPSKPPAPSAAEKKE